MDSSLYRIFKTTQWVFGYIFLALLLRFLSLCKYELNCEEAMRMTFTFYVCLSEKPKAGHSPHPKDFVVFLGFMLLVFWQLDGVPIFLSLYTPSNHSLSCVIELARRSGKNYKLENDINLGGSSGFNVIMMAIA